MKLEKEVHFDNVIVGGNRGDNLYNAYISCHIFLKGKEQDMLKNKKCKGELILEVQEPILDDAERKYLSGVIRPFRNEIECIRKVPNEYYKTEHLVIYFKDNMNMPFPYFKKGSMYKGMKVDKDYTLDGLCL